MKLSLAYFAGLASLTFAIPALGNVMSTEYRTIACAEGDREVCSLYHADRCDAGDMFSCRRLAYLTLTECASPGGAGGCKYDSSKEY